MVDPWWMPGGWHWLVCPQVYRSCLWFFSVSHLQEHSVYRKYGAEWEGGWGHLAWSTTGCMHTLLSIVRAVTLFHIRLTAVAS